MVLDGKQGIAQDGLVWHCMVKHARAMWGA